MFVLQLLCCILNSNRVWKTEVVTDPIQREYQHDFTEKSNTHHNKIKTLFVQCKPDKHVFMKVKFITYVLPTEHHYHIGWTNKGVGF